MHRRSWTKIWTKILDNHFLMTDNNAYLVFTKLLLSANSQGELLTTSREFAAFVGLTHSACVRTIERSEKQGIVEKFATTRSKNTIFKVKKWKAYLQRIVSLYQQASDTDARAVLPPPVAPCSTILFGNPFWEPVCSIALVSALLG